MHPVIYVKDLHKNYGSLKAVDGLSFTVEKGEIYGLLGPNGAGKTTTLEIIEGLRKRSSGHVRVLDFDPSLNPEAVKQRIGIQLQASAYYEELSLKELLNLYGSFYKKKIKPLELLKEVNLQEKIKARVGQLSGGQKQRFSIAASLVNDPEVVFLDEPTTGLDPQARHNLWEFILKIKKSGRTIILTTHYMEEAEILADHVAIVDSGKIVAQGRPRELIQKLNRACTISFVCKNGINIEDLKKLPGVKALEQPAPQRFHLLVTSPAESVTLILEYAKQKNLNLLDFHVDPATLEDVFLNITGKALRD